MNDLPAKPKAFADTLRFLGLLDPQATTFHFATIEEKERSSRVYVSTRAVHPIRPLGASRNRLIEDGGFSS